MVSSSNQTTNAKRVSKLEPTNYFSIRRPIVLFTLNSDHDLALDLKELKIKCTSPLKVHWEDFSFTFF